MQGEISTALASAITAQTDQLTMLKQVGDLEKEISNLKAWEDEKKRYKLERFDPGVLVYSLKPEDARGEPPHYLCATCYQNGMKSILQATTEIRYSRRVHLCPQCKTELAFGPEIAPPRRPSRTSSEYDPFSRLP
jgi:hypothetical protein